MKKRIAILLGMALVVGSLAGCGGGKVASVQKTPAAGEETDGEAAPTGKTETESGETAAIGDSENVKNEMSERTFKTGLAVRADISGSKDAAEEDGAAQTDVTMAAVTVDAEGRIVTCVIDSLQTKIGFNEEGKLTTDLSAEILTKQELGGDYGMKVASSIGKEWNEQADAFAAYCVGKTLEEVSGIAVSEAGKAEEADLASSVTIGVADFISLVTEAVDNAR